MSRMRGTKVRVRKDNERTKRRCKKIMMLASSSYCHHHLVVYICLQSLLLYGILHLLRAGQVADTPEARLFQPKRNLELLIRHLKCSVKCVLRGLQNERCLGTGSLHACYRLARNWLGSSTLRYSLHQPRKMSEIHNTTQHNQDTTQHNTSRPSLLQPITSASHSESIHHSYSS